MAGHRRASGKPTRQALKAARRREHYWGRLANATTSPDRIAATADFVRATFGKSADATAVAGVVAELLQAGDRAWVARHRAQVRTELDATGDASRRLTVAVDYLRAALGSDPSGAAVEIAEHAIRRLWDAADEHNKAP
ncbi:hypothetical protein [Actinomadura oligospora]|uniref:hypothetical protein n=1 Tax=Actinomadura oligospora TaxID=111804 RepID=UPI00047B8C22|nr:hypothetical protein [Actinomadura oligospora]